MRRPGTLLPVLLVLLAAGAVARAGETTRRTVRVYYFHTTARCASCRTIETLTGEAVRDGFARDVKQGRLEMVLVNVDEPANKHFVRDYGLYTKSVVLVELVDGVPGRFKNLPKIWELLHDPGLFQGYVRGEVRAFLDLAP